MIEEIIKIGMDKIVELEEFSLVVEISMDKIEVDLGMNKITGMIIGEEKIEAMWEHIKILEERIIEEDKEEMIGMKMITQKEVGVGLEKDHIQTIIAEVETEIVVIVDQGQDQEQVEIETALGIINVWKMITSQRIAPTTKEERERE